MASSSSSSSSYAPRKRGWTYDVFLSFRGEDTRYNFVDHLYAALDQKGIHPFKDDKMLGGGQPITEELLKAIKESRWAVVVFSKNYANSSWCLEELSMIMECHKQMGQKVLPVFYHVYPSNLRKKKRDFTMRKFINCLKFRGESDQVNKWRDALIAAVNICGQHILPGYGETEFISKIVKEILADKQLSSGSMENHLLIGIEPRIDALTELLNMEATEDVCFVGICGMGGIGKTTIARTMFNRIAGEFEGSSFINEIRENSSSTCTLQETILKDILGEHHGYNIEDPNLGAEIIKERCCRKKVLLVLDYVNDVKQLEFLAATREWFGPGSRIIITTRDQHLLTYADETYKPAILSGDEAIELFSRRAFNKKSPPEGYEELSIRAINHAGGIPLALEVLGLFFRGREANNEWESALNRLAKSPDDKIFKRLKLSYDELDESEKEIFLDIACLYNRKDVDYVTRILDSLGFDTVIGIKVLVDKSLLTISRKNKLVLHDLIQKMGQKEVEASATITRLWELKKIHDLINKQKELELIEGIVVPWKLGRIESLSADVFKGMKNLRVLDCFGKFTSREPGFLPDELRWFCWTEYPFSSLPVAHMSKLVGLEMVEGKIKHLWKEKIMIHNLKFINLKRCEFLTRFPDVSGAPNIERLNLARCVNMVEVDESVGSLKKLLHLDMTGCFKLKRLPSTLQMESLKTLILKYCFSLKRIPELSPCMVNLSEIDISHCKSIEKVPFSILKLLNL